LAAEYPNDVVYNIYYVRPSIFAAESGAQTVGVAVTYLPD